MKDRCISVHPTKHIQCGLPAGHHEKSEAGPATQCRNGMTSGSWEYNVSKEAR